MTREDINVGDVIILSNSNNFRILNVNGTKYLMREGTYIVGNPLISICDSNFKPLGNYSPIKEIYRDNKLIWTKPIEMTIAEIENALKLTPGSLRIKD